MHVSHTDAAGPTAVRRSSRTLALASAVTSLTFFSLPYGDLRFRDALPKHASIYIPHWNLHNVGYGTTRVGFVLAAVGFWIAPASTQVSNANANSDFAEATP